MSEAVKEFARSQGLGHLDRVVQLSGAVTLEDGSEAEPFLCQSAEGVWLVAASSPSRGMTLSLPQRDDVRYESSKLRGDRLVIGDTTYGVPRFSGADVKAALAVGRICANMPTRSAATALIRHRYIEGPTPAEEAWLRSWLEPDECALSWLRTATEVPLHRGWEAGGKADWRFVLTDRRAALAAIGSVGDILVREINATTLTITEGGLRHTVACGQVRWSATVMNGGKYRELGEAVTAAGCERLRRIAQCVWTRTPKHEKPGPSAAALLHRIIELGEADELDCVLMRLLPIAGAWEREAWLDIEDEAMGVAIAAIAGLSRTDANAERIAQWYRDWELSAEIGRTLVGGLLPSDVDVANLQWALPLHRAVRDRIVAAGSSPAQQALADIALAEHLVAAERSSEANEVMAARLPKLPDESIGAILPVDDTDGAGAGGGQFLRRRVLELLCLTTPRDSAAYPRWIAEMVQVQPFSGDWLEELIATAEPDLRLRAIAAKALLHEAGKPAAALDTEDGTLSPLPSARPLAAECVELLRHPAARSGGVGDWVRDRIAEHDAPSVGSLEEYAEQVSQSKFPEVIAALADGVTLLGHRAVPAYVTHGSRSVGVRAYARPTAAVVVGADHLAADSAWGLSRAGLRFAIGSELAHLAFGHVRVTRSEVLTGAWHKGSAALGLATIIGGEALLDSVLSTIDQQQVYSAIRSVVPLDVLKSLTGQEDGRKVRSALFNDPGAAAERLASGARLVGEQLHVGEMGISLVGGRVADRAARASCVVLRVMQLTADRVGLLLAGDLAESARAMFLTEPELHAELAVIDRVGYLPALGRRDETGRLVVPGPATRLAALVAFYLSDDFSKLRHAAYGP